METFATASTTTTTTTAPSHPPPPNITTTTTTTGTTTGSLLSARKESIKLPNINSARQTTTTNSPTQSTNNSFYIDLNKFNQQVNNVKDKKSKNEIYENELNHLKNDLIKSIVNALMSGANSEKDWKTLGKCFELIEPISSCFENDRRVHHYIERIYFSTNNRSSTNLANCNQVLNQIAKLFPKSIENIKSTGTPRTFSNQSNEKIEKSILNIIPDAQINFFNGRVDPYKNQLKDLRFKTSFAPTVAELTDSLSKVAIETFKFESNWRDKLSTINLASSLNLEELEQPDDQEQQKLKKENAKKFSKEDLFKLKSEIEESDANADGPTTTTTTTFQINYNPGSYRHQVPDFEEKCLNLSGRELVFHLLKETHLGNAVSFYLNHAEDTKYYRPYDLITVPQSKKNAEHYIFSAFGVLHIVPGEENEQLSLSDWNRDAILWEACSKIKFFREFLFHKFLNRWRKNSKFSRFRKLRKTISKRILITIPFYSEALILISNLIQQIISIKFLPKDEEKYDLFKDYLESTKNVSNISSHNSKTNINESESNSQMGSSRMSINTASATTANANNTNELIERVNKRKNKKKLDKESFNLNKFLNALNVINSKSDQLLKYFFAFIKYVLDHTRFKLYEKLRFYEALVSMDEPLDVAKSMSLQKSVKAERERELNKTRYQIGFLGNFIDLVSAFLGSKLLQISLSETKKFLDEFIECNEAKRESLFEAELGFDENDNLCLVPSKEKFIDSIMNSVKRIERSIIDASKILDFEGTLRDVERYGFKIEKPKPKENELLVEEEEEDEEVLKVKDPNAYYEKLIEKQPKDLPLKKPQLNFNKDFDESLLNERLVISHKEEKLKIRNYILKAQANPLKPISFAGILLNDSQLKSYLNQIETYLTDATNEINTYCDENGWISDIKHYISKYTPNVVLEWKAIGSYEIEDQLNKIRNWNESIKSNVEKTIITRNKLLKIDTKPIEDILVPKLESIYNETCECVLKEINIDSLSFIELITQITKELTNRPKSIEEFANYAKIVTKHKTNISSYETKINLIKSLIDVVRINYRSLSTEEEQLDTQSQELWKSLMFVLKESVEFVNIQSPNILEQLDGLFKKYLEELRQIHYAGTTGKYLDPYEDSTQILEELKEQCYEFAAVEKILRQCASWRESITEQSEDISFINRLSVQLYTRKDLWKYFEVTFHHIKDWKNSQIKKINVKKIEEKLNFWEQEAKNIKKYLPEDDKVWLSWYNSLQSFKMIMKWIAQLGSDTFKVEHFDDLFAAIGIVYDKEKNYTIQDLIDLKLDDYADLINNIYKRASAEYSSIQQFNQIKELWNNKIKFKLAKNFPLKLYNSDVFNLRKSLSSSSSSLSSRTTSSSVRVKELKEISEQQLKEQENLMQSITYKLVDINEIRFNCDDSVIKLNLILNSQINTKIKEDVQELILKLNHAMQISELWLNVQHKWLFLEKLYVDTETIDRPMQETIAFHQIVKEFKEFQFKIVDDPIVIDIIKDETNKLKLNDWLKRFSNICDLVDNELEQNCIEFPRFYFLTKDQLIETISHKRDCRKFIDSVRNCFSGVKDLVYSLPAKKPTKPALNNNNNGRDDQPTITKVAAAPNKQQNPTTLLDFDINANELEVIAVIGHLAMEKFRLFTSLKSYDLQRTTEWFINLEKIMKSSLCFHTQNYLDLIDLYDYSNLPLLTKRIENLKETPIQAVVFGETVTWCRNVTKIIETKNYLEFNNIINYFNKSISEFSNHQLNNSNQYIKELYSKVTLWMVFARDLTQVVSETKSLNEFSFEWLRILKYSFTKRVVIKNEDVDFAPNKAVKLRNKYENFFVNQMTASINYDFEYLDFSNQLALTPLTEKCFLNLTAALSSIRCGTLIGPNSSGKRQTIHLLSQACGQYLKEISCDRHLDNEIAIRYIKGLVSSGNWILFDKIEHLEPSVLSSIGYQLGYIRNSIKNLLNKDSNQVGSKNQERPTTSLKATPKNQRVTTVPVNTQNCDLRTYFEEPYNDVQVYQQQPLKPSNFHQLKLKGLDSPETSNLIDHPDDEVKRINELINYGQNKPDIHYQRKWLGYIIFQSRIVRVNANYGCFFTANSIESLPLNLKANLRVCSIIEPDCKQIAIALFTCYGSNQGVIDVETLANKLIDFLNQLPTIISNEFVESSGRNLSLLSKIIKLTAIKYTQDKGRQDRTLSLILSCLFTPTIKSDSEKLLFNLLLKKIFDNEPNNIIEEILSALLKDQLTQMGFKISQKQLQKMIEFYIGTRVNQFVILAGPPLDGKTTIWKTIARAINSFQPNENDLKTKEIFKKYSILNNFLGEDNSFPRILTYHLFPNVHNNLKLFENNFHLVADQGEQSNEALLNKFVSQSESSYLATVNLQKEETNNKKVNSFKQIEKWILLDGGLNESILIDQMAVLKGKSISSHASNCQIPETIKFIFETSDLSDLNPSILSQTLFIIQQDLEWLSVLETRINLLCFKYIVPQSKVSLLFEYSTKFFTELNSKLKSLNFKSILHGSLNLSEINFNNLIISYINLLDCLLKRFINELKELNSENISNWRALKPISIYGFFWSVAMFVSSETDVNNLSDFVIEILEKHKLNTELTNGIRLNECEINIQQSLLVPVQRIVANTTNKDWIINEYQSEASIIKLCIENSKPCLIYGDIGIGKTNLIEKILTNKYDFAKLINTEPNNTVYKSLLKHTPFCRNKKNMSLNDHKFNFIYFIDDVNYNYNSCGDNGADGGQLMNVNGSPSSSSSNLELIRQITETNSIYFHENNYFMPFSDINFIFCCSYPNKSPNYLPLKQSQTKNLICVHLNPNQHNLVESIFKLPIQQWLEEFPPDSVQYPTEIAQSIVKSLFEVYESVREVLKPVPSKPYYLFNFKDVAKVVQGLNLLASKSKLVPTKISKKLKEQQDQSIGQVATIIKLLCHEILRVFCDRISDKEDENWFKSLLINIITNNFCVYKESQTLNEPQAVDSTTNMKSSSTEQISNDSISNNAQSINEVSTKPKKAVTFKTGLLIERNFRPYNGALITREQLGIINQEIFSNIIFSRFIVKMAAPKGTSVAERSSYNENSLSDLMNSATASLDGYERSKSQRMNFFFHEEAIRHLARLTRVFSMSRSHALLVSHQNGLGRTNSVRLCAFLSKMKYFESRVTSDEEKSEKYLKSVLKQCCLISGIKGSNSILYIKSEFHSHKIIKNLCAFIRTGIYPGLFNEKEICTIASEITPTIPSTKRIERTLFTYNNFLNSIQERVHVVISLESGLTTYKMANLLREHSVLFTDFYMDVYKPFDLETLNSIARYYLALQIEETKARCLNKKYSRFDEDENLSVKEIQVFSSIMVDLHLIAHEQYTYLYNSYQNYYTKESFNKILMPKPFNVSILKQMSLFLKIYIKRIREQENAKIDKFERAFKKISQITHKIEHYDDETESLRKKLIDLEKLLEKCDQKIEKQKTIYKMAVDECRKEEKLIDEMNVALEKLRSDVNKNNQSVNNQLNPQYDLALKAIESLSESDFNELRSYRSPPQRVLAVVNTLCLMFRQPPGWENGKQLLLRERFFEDLIYYDKINMPEDIYNALSQICAVETFRPDYVAPGSRAAASFCQWILTIYNFATFERNYGVKTRELKQYEELFNKRLAALGEKRINAEKLCQVLEGHCAERINVLKDIKKAHSEVDKLKESELKARELLKLLEEDNKSWTDQYNRSMKLIKTYKMDALMVSCFVSYLGIFDPESRSIVKSKWFATITKLNNLSRPPTIKFDNSKNNTKEKPFETMMIAVQPIGKYSLRSGFNFKEILINSYENKDLMIQLNKMSLKDDYFIENALIFRELCSLPTLMSWPLIYDPENYTLKLISLLQESIESMKYAVNQDYYGSSPITAVSGGPLKPQDSTNEQNSESGTSNEPAGVNESTIAERDVSTFLIDETFKSNMAIAATTEATNSERTTATIAANRNGLTLKNVNSFNKSSNFNDLSSQQNIEQVESMPPYSMTPSVSSQSRKSLSSMSHKSFNTINTQASTSIWEASTFYSRAQTAATVYHTKSGKPFLPSLNIEYEQELLVPTIETDLNVMPKDNLCLLDSADPELDYKLINAAVHGVVVFLKNAERFTQPNRLIEILFERDFYVDSRSNREYLKIGDEEIFINQSFKLILHVNTPISLNYVSKHNYLFHRLTTQLNAAHCVIDFSPSNNFISNDFLNMIMEFEKQGYINQTLVRDKILLDSESRIFNRQEEIIERLSSSEQSILEDTKIMSYTTDKITKLKELQDSFSEAAHIEKNLKELNKFYVPILKTVTTIFDSLKMIYLIQPIYYTNWSFVKQLIQNELESNLNKGIMGPARAKQIEKFCVSLIYRYLSSLMTQTHFKLLLFLHSLHLNSSMANLPVSGVTPPKLNTSHHHKSNKTTISDGQDTSGYNQHQNQQQQQQHPSAKLVKSESSLTKFELFKLIDDCLKQNELQNLYNSDFTLLSSQPEFVSLNSWINFSKLETNSSNSFHSLTKSLRENSTKWIEYFHLNVKKNSIIDLTENEIDLLNETPFDAKLSLIQKLIIWLCIRPDKTFEILNKFIVYNFGGLIPTRIQFDLITSQKISAPHIPYLIILPKDENSYLNITVEISKKAKSYNEDIKLIVFALDNQLSKFKRLNLAIREAMKSGSWVLIENAHFTTEWPKEILQILYKIKDNNYSKEELDYWQDYNLNIPEVKGGGGGGGGQGGTGGNGGIGGSGGNEEAKDKKIFIHDNFRLWLTAQSDQIQNLPTSLIYNAIKITPQVSDLKQTYLTCQNSIKKELNPVLAEEASILHTLITHNDFMQKYNWNLQHFQDYLRSLSELKDSIPSDSLIDLVDVYQRILCEMTYGPKLNNKIDFVFIKKLIHQIVIDKKYDIQQFVENSHKFYSKLENSINSKSLAKEIRILFEIEKSKYLKQESNDSNEIMRIENYLLESSRNQDKLTLKFSPEFLKHLNESLTDLVRASENINNLIVNSFNASSWSEKNSDGSTLVVDPIVNKQNLISFILDLNDFKKLFDYLTKMLNSLVDSIRGATTTQGSNELLNTSILEFYIFIDKFSTNESSLNFFQMLKTQIKNSIDICDKIYKIYQEFQSNSEIVVINKINLDELFNPRRVLNKILFDLYYSLKNHQKTITASESNDGAAAGATTTGVGSTSSTNNSNTNQSNSNLTANMRILQTKEKHFLLEVVDSNNLGETNEFNLYLENICIVNAFYEIMSNSFKSTANKSIKKLEMVRVTPILNEFSKSENTYKYIPFIDIETRELICIFRVKFWLGNQSSLSSTTQSSKEPPNAANILNKLNGKCDDAMSTVCEDAASSSAINHKIPLQNIPIFNPIYFCIFNSSQNFLSQINKFIKKF